MIKTVTSHLTRRLFDLPLPSDIYEHACERGVRPMLDGKRRDRLRAVRDAGALFIHVPKNAGMSISNALYGRQIKHATVRYYARVAPDLLGALPSFAILRDPVARFVSAYHFAQAGGSSHSRVSVPFRAPYMALRSIDAALDHVEQAASPYQVNHIFRPQSWYVCGVDGAVAVDRLFAFEDMDSVAVYLRDHGIAALARLNEGERDKQVVSAAQVDRLRILYARDFEMFEEFSTRSCNAVDDLHWSGTGRIW